MLKRLRRASKVARSTNSSNSTNQVTVATQLSATPRKTFFDLPAELRNQIYEYAAENTTLHLNTKESQSTKQRAASIPSLLIASRQCRAEYLPILLATSCISTYVHNFDFTNVTRITGGLYSTELKALRSNPHLYVLLTFAPPGPRFDVKACQCALRTWIASRSAGMDRLPWHYALPMQGRTPRLSGHGRFTVEYRKCMAVVKGLMGQVDEALQWELEIVLWEVEVQDEVMVGYWEGRDQRCGGEKLS